MKKVLIIVGTPTKDDYSDQLAKQFAKGAEEAGNSAEIVYVCDLHLESCKGCWGYRNCWETGFCFQQDDANKIHFKMMEADVICFSTIVYYYYNVTGLLQDFMGRMEILSNLLKNKDFYYIVTGLDYNRVHLEFAIELMKGFGDVIHPIRRCGYIYAGESMHKNDAEDTPDGRKAYEMGKNVCN